MFSFPQLLFLFAYEGGEDSMVSSGLWADNERNCGL